MNNDEFLTELYDRLHDSPMQQKLRKLAPMPVGVVFLQSPYMSKDDIRNEFRKMKQLGFTALKQVFPCPGTSHKELMHMALDEGIIPWWYGEAGWEAITDELLKKLGIPTDMPIEQICEDKRMIQYQTGILRRRIDEAKPLNINFDPSKAPLDVGVKLPDSWKADFIYWLKETYKTVENLVEAWNLKHILIVPDNHVWESWEEVEEKWQKLGDNEYRHLRDILRFKADVSIKAVREIVDKSLENDPNEPFRAGGEMGLFLPFAYRGTDMEGLAEEMGRGGSFYPSIHLAWHFDEVDHEVARPIYMQAAISHDWFKGGWSATWESTGGPQQFSGGKGGGGFTVDDKTITQLMLSYLATGYKGFGLWCWNVRTAGWEAGEYALLDRNLQPGKRAVRAGKIGKTARKYKDELWKAHKEPLVGVFAEFDNEAIWAAMSVTNRDCFRQFPINARAGVSRALINRNIPYEYVTGSDLRNGLAARYKVIYLPAVIAINNDLMEILSKYVYEGGRLVIDMPSAWYDEYGKLMPIGAGSLFEKTFGTVINDFQYSNEINTPLSINGFNLKGFVLDMTPTSSKVAAVYQNGMPAITENAFGKGHSIILGYEASYMCFKPGNTWAEDMLLNHAMGEYEAPYECDNAIVYRIAAPSADHYFVINDFEEKTFTINTKDYKYKSVIDAMTGEVLEIGKQMLLEGYGGRWLRFEKTCIV